MCGFAGEFLITSGRADPSLAHRMASRLRHRGPDDDATFLSADGRCAIGFRRLAVIDPLGSRQPMTSDDGLHTVAFNGEIYNFRQLRAELEAAGARFHTAGDTEVLLHLYRRLGDQMLPHLQGMFAFAIYDQTLSQLLLARDRLGQKPLWYAHLPDRVVFASEAKALLVHPGVDTTVDMLSLQHFLTLGYIPAPHSAWRGIAKLLPAHMLRFSGPRPRSMRYWSLPSDGQPPPGDVRLEGLRERLARSVEARMVSDVPIGALLSGGLDSSIVVALMVRAAGQSGGVRTFTAGFEHSDFDERPVARLLATHCRTHHTELLIRPDPVELLDSLAAMYDEPFADSSALPTWLICRAARQHVTVALGGDGGDEVFAGYDRYRAMHLAATLHPAAYTAVRLAARLARPWAGHNERRTLPRLIRFADALTEPPAMQYFSYRRLFSPDDLARLLTRDWAASCDLHATADWFCDLYEQGECFNELARAQRHDLLTYLPDDLLVKTDIASMAASLELRAPLLDHRVVELGMSLPPALRISARRGKIALRRAFADLLPAEVLRAPKRGFAVPLGEWLRNELRDTLIETLTDPALLQRGMFEPAALGGLINDHLQGRADHRHRLWALLVLAKWLVRHG